MGAYKRGKRVKNLRNSVILLCLALLLSGCQVKEYVQEYVQEQDGGAADSVEDAQDVSGEMRVTFLDVGQGDCTIVQASGHNMVIDAGNNGQGGKVVSYLEELGIEKLDYFILTHPDADHIGGADDVMENVEVEQIIMPDVSNDTKTYADVEHDIVTMDIPVIDPEVGAAYKLGDASFEILCPSEIKDNDLNVSSAGIKLTHGKKSFVMCADAEAPSEKAMTETFGSGLECDVLKCGHHGSATATTEEFLENTDPVWAVISCGENNRYGHPHAEVISRLEDADVQIYRTDKLGTITAVSDGENISWKSER